MLKRNELEKTIGILRTDLNKAEQQLNKVNAIEKNSIELFTDGVQSCLKIYYNELELSIVFRKRELNSEYNGKHRFELDDAKVFDVNSNEVKEFKDSIQITNTVDLLSVLNAIGEYENE
jgi:hypothetical protein